MQAKTKVRLLVVALALFGVWVVVAEVRNLVSGWSLDTEVARKERALKEKAKAENATKAIEKKLDAASIANADLRERVERLTTEETGGTVTARGEIETGTVEGVLPCVPVEATPPSRLFGAEEDPSSVPSSAATPPPARLRYALGPARFEWAEVSGEGGSTYVVPSDLVVRFRVPPDGTLLDEEHSVEIVSARYEVPPPPPNVYVPRTLLGFDVGAVLRSCGIVDESVAFAQGEVSKTVSVERCASGVGVEAGLAYFPKRWATAGRWAEGRLGLYLDAEYYLGDGDVEVGLGASFLFGIGRR